MSSFIPVAEMLAGAGCLVVAFFLFAPLKRFSARQVQGRGGVFVLDEFLVILWIVLALVGICLLIYPLT
jgi:hypothetical protein